MEELVHLEINLQEKNNSNRYNLKLSQDTPKLMNSLKEKWKQFKAILDHMIG